MIWKLKLEPFKRIFPFHFSLFFFFPNNYHPLPKLPFSHYTSCTRKLYRRISTHTSSLHPIHTNTPLLHLSLYRVHARNRSRTSIHERRVVCGSPFKTRIVHDPENVAGFSTSLGASAGSSASGNLPIRSRNHRTSCFPENVEKSFPRSESRLGTPPTPQTFNVCRLNVWNVWYIVFDEGSITTSFFVAIFSFDLPLYLSSSGNKRKERGLIILRGGGGLVCRSSPRSDCRFKKYIFSYCEILIRVSSRKSFSKVCETLLYSRF